MTSPTESKIHTRVATWLRLVERTLGEPMVWTSTVNEGRRGWRAQATIKAHGMRAGWPDITILHKGQALHVELKAAKGRLSPAQREVAEQIVAAGGFWTVARSLEDVQEWLKTQGRDWPLLPEQRIGSATNSKKT